LGILARAAPSAVQSMPKILFLSHRVPYPPDKGEKIRAFHILEHLTRHHDVWFGSLADEASSRARLEWFHSRCRDVCIIRRSPIEGALAVARASVAGSPMSVAAFSNLQFARWCDATTAKVKPDIVFVFSSAMAQFAPGSASAALLIDFVDADSEKYRQYASAQRGPLRLLYRSEADRLLKFDCNAAHRAKACLFVSQTERDLFAARCPEMDRVLHVMPNGVDCAYFDPEAVRSQRGQTSVITFTGRMDYFPNVDAVSWFARAVFPKVRAAVPDTRFRIVGAQPSRAVRALVRTPGIEVTGAVADIRPYYAEATLCVAPLRIARGIQNKVLEAMAMAKPVVVTSAALDGISAIDGEHVLVADSAEEFAAKVVSILHGQAPSRLGQSARARVLSHHDWRAQLTRLDQLIGGICPAG
jgi:sugar transferase (PEP-CTERM/EpsH1 system associated)